MRYVLMLVCTTMRSSERSDTLLSLHLAKAAFLYGKRLESTGQTNQLITGGRGGPKCKDALLSVVVNRN